MAVNKMKNMTVFEMLSRVNKLSNRDDRVNALREYNSLALRDVLKGGYDDTIQFIIPEGSPPYKEADKNKPPTSLIKQSKMFRFFAKGGPGEKLPAIKVESMFISLLEGIHPDDAKVVIAMKDKVLPDMFKNITKKMVSDAFPGLIAK